MPQASRPIVEHALAIAETGLKVFRLRPLDKRPLYEGWQQEATTDPAVIAQWWAENPNMNYGIPTGLDNNLDVIDLDGPEAVSWWRSTGFHSDAMVATPSGPNRVHVYWRIDDVEIPNSQSRLAPHVDVRGEGGYVVGPGSIIPAGTYRGTIRNIPDMPAELIAMMPQRQQIIIERPDVPEVEVASTGEQAQIERGIADLDALPRPWHEGAGWRSTMYRVACWFLRMAQTPGYAITEEQALQIILDHTPTDDVWTTNDLMHQWDSARKSVAGQYADAPHEMLPPFLPFLDVANLLPDRSPSGLVFSDLIMGEPDIRTASSYWQRRQIIMREALSLGMTPQQAATLGWHAAVSIALQATPGGAAEVWREVATLQAELEREAEESAEQAAAPGPGALEERVRRIPLLDKRERDYLASENGHWWGDRYLQWARDEVKVFNAPYHRAALWVVLASALAEYGYVPTAGRPTDLNVYVLTLGDTSTGKSEAKAMEERCIKACFPSNDTPLVGPKVSEVGLLRKLAMRDGKPSVLLADEASGLFKQMRDANWAAGLSELFAQLYDNDIPGIEMTTHRDVSGVDATTWFTFHLSGVFKRTARVLTFEEWESGLLPRMMIAIGEPKVREREAFRLKLKEGEEAQHYDRMPKHWAAEFAQAVQKLKVAAAQQGVNVSERWQIPLGMEKQAIDRHDILTARLADFAAGHELAEQIDPYTVRLGVNVLKCAGLVAMSEGAPKITGRHMLIAIDYAEEWLANAVALAQATSATALTRKLDDLEKFIATQRGSEVDMTRVYQFSKVDKRSTDSLVELLEAQGRIAKGFGALSNPVVFIKRPAIRTIPRSTDEEGAA
ncbi:bifunctional DNA primase/polymerase [Agromyces sp. NPDC058104]|uniref:bifunctional DNA primase/polymerase n=1 Tax=Agromyces sp. NPDC058104 TaxID=3346342 RepID=UPI0036DB0665